MLGSRLGDGASKGVWPPLSKRENENIRRAASHRYAVIPLCMHCYGRRSTKLITVLYGTYIPTQGRQSTDYSVT